MTQNIGMPAADAKVAARRRAAEKLRKKVAASSLGALAGLQVHKLERQTESEGFGNFMIAAVPFALFTALVLHSMYVIEDNSFSAGFLSKSGLYREGYQTWYVGVITIIVTSLGVFLARLPILETRANERRSLINKVVSAEQALVDLRVTAESMRGDGIPSVEPLQNTFLDRRKNLDGLQELPIAEDLNEIDRVYSRLKYFVTKWEDHVSKKFIGTLDSSKHEDETKLESSIKYHSNTLCELIDAFISPRDPDLSGPPRE
jgi:hypothetical protein